jgi:hypothetical protein
MRYPLLSHFQGALLGAAIGEVLGANCQNLSQKSWLEVDHWGFQPLSCLPETGAVGQRVLQEIQRLTRDLASPDAVQMASLPTAGVLPVLAIATLPLALFYHEDRWQRHTQVRQRLEQWQQPPDAYPIIGLVSDLLALAVQGNLNPRQVILQLLAHPEQGQLPPSAVEMLQQAQFWLEQFWLEPAPRQPFGSMIDAWLEPVANSPEQADFAAILLALTAFLATPDAFQVALLRVARQHQPHLVCALTGALLGAYGGKASLPPDWRQALRAPLGRRSPLFPLWDVQSEAELLKYAQLLLATWSGVYNPRQNLNNFTASAVVAAPQMIRSR